MNSIGVLEERTAHLGLIWQEFIKIHRFIQEKIDDQENNRLPDLYKNTINLLKTRFNKRAKDFDEPIYLVSIFLTPEFRKIACGGKYNFNDYTNMIVDLAINWNFSFNDSVKIGNQLQSYFENIDPHYGWESDPVKYWQSMKKHPELAKFALMVFAIYPSSGKVERLFSIMSCTKTKKRNNLSKDTVTDIAKIKLDFRYEANKKKEKKQVAECVEDNEDSVNVDLTEEVLDDEDADEPTTIVNILFDLSLMPFKTAEKRKALPEKPFTTADVIKALKRNV